MYHPLLNHLPHFILTREYYTLSLLLFLVFVPPNPFILSSLLLSSLIRTLYNYIVRATYTY